MKKLKSFLVVAFLAIGFAASAQTITISNTTGQLFQAYFSNGGIPCSPSPAPIIAGFSGTVTVTCPPPLISDRVELVFVDNSCTPPRINQRIVALCNTPTLYTNCNNQIINVYYDCATQYLHIF